MPPPLNKLLSPLLRPWGWLLLAAIIYTPWIDTEVGTGNVASDLAAIESLGEHGTFFINGSAFEGTIDKFKRGERFFSQKSPVIHLVAVLPYLALRAGGLRLATHTALCLRVLTFFMTILPMGWLLWLIFDNPWMRVQSLRARLWLTLGFAAGSLLTPFAVTLNHYILASAFLMLAVNCLTAYQLAGRAPDARLGLICGAAISASLACDVPPAFIFGAGLAAVWIIKRRGSPLLALIAGSAPLLLLYAALNQSIIGSPLPPNFHEREMLYYPGSYWSELKDQEAKFGPGYYESSYARRIFHATLGYKGVYWMMPLLTLASVAAIRAARRQEPGWQLAAACAFFPIVTIAVTMRWAIDLSGGAYGIRHAFAALPPLYCVLGRCDWTGKLTRTAAVFSGAWGCGIAFIGLLNPWSHNTLSAFPPLENLARLALHHPRDLPTDWIAPLISATSIDPANAWLDLGLERIGEQRLPEAELSLRRAIEANPRIPLPYYHLGIALDMDGRSEEAMEAYRPLLAIQPENVGAWNNFGVFALKSRRLQEAKNAYARSLDLAPQNPSALWGELMIADLEGRAGATAPRLAEALRLYPDDPRLQAIARRWGATGSTAPVSP